MALLRRPYLLAVLLHAVLFGALALYSMPTRKAVPSPTAARPSAAATQSGDQRTAAGAPFSGVELQSRLEKSVSAARRLSVGEQFSAAGDYAKQLESISSVASMKEIGAYLRSSVAPKPRASTAEPGKEKVFDHATSTPVGAREVGGGEFAFVFRDARGNVCEIPASPEAQHAARAMALLDRSDVLREFKNSVLLPMLQERLDANP